MSACKKHAASPVKGYLACPGCEVENLRAEVEALRRAAAPVSEQPSESVFLHSIAEAGRCLGVAQAKGDKPAIEYWSAKVDQLVSEQDGNARDAAFGRFMRGYIDRFEPDTPECLPLYRLSARIVAEADSEDAFIDAAMAQQPKEPT